MCYSIRPYARGTGVIMALLWLPTILAQAQPVITQQPASQIVSPGVNVAFTVALSTTNAGYYQWQCNGTNLPSVITTIAGNGTTTTSTTIPTFAGDGGSAISALLNSPQGVVVDSVGNIIISDTANNRIRKVSTNGIITTMAGNGTNGYAGDGGMATSAELNDPASVALDNSGNLYIADKGNSAIRKVNPNGVISTVVFSSEVWSPNGIAVDSAGNLFIPSGSLIRKVSPSGVLSTVAGTNAYGYSGDGGFATNATLNGPSAVAVDAYGNLFIADWYNNAIRKVSTNGIITTVISSAGGLSRPAGITVDGFGNLFIPTGCQIRKMDTNGLITIVAGSSNNNYGFSGDGGSATNATLNAPNCVAMDALGNFLIADSANQRIRKVDTNGIITTIAGTTAIIPASPATSAGLNYPGGVTVDSAGNLYIADTGNQRICKVGTNGNIFTVAGNGGYGFSGDGGAATTATFSSPLDVAVDVMGNLYVADTINNRIRRVATNGIITTVAGNGTNWYSGDLAAATNAALSNPYGVTVDGAGNLFIADSGNQCIRKVDTNGIITTLASGFYWPSGVATDTNGDLLIADRNGGRIWKLQMNGTVSTIAGNGGFGYSGDSGVATNASFDYPNSVAVDIAGNVFIADTGNQRIRKVDVNGIITTVAGNGANGYSGDNGPATGAQLNSPEGVAVDANDDIFIADTSNFRVREVVAQGPTLFLNNVSTNNTGNYQVVITTSQGSITSSVASLVVSLPVAITTRPQSEAAFLSSNAVFNVFAVGAGPISYQWYFSNPALQTDAGAVAETAYGFFYGAIVTNAGSGYTTIPQVQFIGGGGNGAAGTAVVSNGVVIAINVTNAVPGYTNPPLVAIDPPSGLLIGQTNSALNLWAISSNTLGSYFVVVSNLYGSVTSAPASLVIAQVPTIMQQPQSQFAPAGSNVTFSVAASGTLPLSYQWWMRASQQRNATVAPIVISGFVLAANVTDGGAGYLSMPQVQFVGGSGSGASAVAVVSNEMVAAIDIENAGSGYGTPPIMEIDPPSALMLAGQSNAMLTLPAVVQTNAANYFVIVTNNFGSVTSALAMLTLTNVSSQGPIAPLVSAALQAGGLTLRFIGTPNLPYTLQAATNLTPPVQWESLYTTSTDTNGDWLMMDTNIGGAEKFYRIVSP